MFRTFKEWLEAKGIDETAFTNKTAQEMALLQKEYMQYVSEEMKKALTNSVSKQDITDAVKDLLKPEAVKGLVKSDEIAGWKILIDEATEKANRAIDGIDGKEKKSSFLEGFKSEKENIQSLIKGNSNADVVIKASTNRASIATNPSGLFLPEIGQLGVKQRSLYDILPKIPVGSGNHQGLVRYVDWDEATTVRSAAIVAEGGAFPESTAKFKGYSKELVKIGDSLPVSEEFGTDEVAAAAELEMFLETNVKTKVDAELINGAGTAGNIEGLVAAAPAFTAAASGIVAPNIYDLVKKVRTSIVFNRGSKYSPDFVVMNANTLDDLHLTKDANQNYVFPDSSGIGSMVIIEDNNLADNVLVVGDRRYARIYEMFGVLISRGLKGDQFVEDMETIKARTRLLMLIRNVDKTGFRKVTSISAALTTLAT